MIFRRLKSDVSIPDRDLEEFRVTYSVLATDLWCVSIPDRDLEEFRDRQQRWVQSTKEVSIPDRDLEEFRGLNIDGCLRFYEFQSLIGI